MIERQKNGKDDEKKRSPESRNQRKGMLEVP